MTNMQKESADHTLDYSLRTSMIHAAVYRTPKIISYSIHVGKPAPRVYGKK